MKGWSQRKKMGGARERTWVELEMKRWSQRKKMGGDRDEGVESEKEDGRRKGWSQRKKMGGARGEGVSQRNRISVDREEQARK